MLQLISERYMEIITIAIITFSLTLSDAKTYADECDRPFNGNREMTALSIANLISPFSGSYVAGAGISRSAIAFGIDQTDSLTQVYSIISAIIVLIAIPFIHAISELPQAVLAAVVLMALHGMVIKQGRKCIGFWKFGRKDDFITWLVTLLVTVLVDLDWGLLIGLLMTIHSVFLRLNQSKLTTLGKVQGTQFFDDVTRGLVEFPGVKIFRLNSPLFFGSKDRFYAEVCREIDSHAITRSVEDDLLHSGKRTASAAVPYHTLVIDASAMIFLDTAGAQQLATLSKWLERNHNARLLVACGNANFVDVFKRVDFGSGNWHGAAVLFPTVHEAVLFGASQGLMHQGMMQPRAVPKVASMPNFQEDAVRSTGWALLFERRRDTGAATQYTPLLNPGHNAVGNPSFDAGGRCSAEPVMTGVTTLEDGSWKTNL
jgi:MFS superfamily sulfate permease-like transporter